MFSKTRFSLRLYRVFIIDLRWTLSLIHYYLVEILIDSNLSYLCFFILFLPVILFLALFFEILHYVFLNSLKVSSTTIWYEHHKPRSFLKLRWDWVIRFDRLVVFIGRGTVLLGGKRTLRRCFIDSTLWLPVHTIHRSKKSSSGCLIKIGVFYF